MNRNDSNDIIKNFKGKNKKVFDLLENIENDKGGYRSSIIWMEKEKEGFHL